MDLASIVRSKADFLIGMRRRIHAHPELSGREFETAALVREELTKAGIEWRPCGLQTGTLAEIRGAKPGRTVLLRADMDALPVTETTGASFASCNPGVMHACGHDCHTAMLLTAALVLQEMREEWGGVVRLAFQPAEESGEGALSMIAQGALEGVYAYFAMHVWSDVPAGRIGLISGPCMAGTDRFEIDVKGVGGHAAQPEHCVDALVAGAAIVDGLQILVSREVSPVDTAVVRYEQKALPTVNDPAVTQVARGAALKVLGPDALYEIGPSMVGEDFCHFAAGAPGCMGLLGVRNEACGAVYGQHHSSYTVDEDALSGGVAMYVQTAIDLAAR